jgi:hypothetical protein
VPGGEESYINHQPARASGRSVLKCDDERGAQAAISIEAIPGWDALTISHGITALCGFGSPTDSVGFLLPTQEPVIRRRFITSPQNEITTADTRFANQVCDNK